MRIELFFDNAREKNEQLAKMEIIVQSAITEMVALSIALKTVLAEMPISLYGTQNLHQSIGYGLVATMGMVFAPMPNLVSKTLILILSNAFPTILPIRIRIRAMEQAFIIESKVTPPR